MNTTINRNIRKFEDENNTLTQHADFLANQMRASPTRHTTADEILAVVNSLVELGRDQLAVARSVSDRGHEARYGADLLDLTQQLYTDSEAILDLDQRLNENVTALLDIIHRVVEKPQPLPRLRLKDIRPRQVNGG
jgi:hypothetical protein